MKSITRQLILFPAAWLYGLATKLRNRLYDLNLLHSADTSVTSISIGNITVGGTGKTPHAEYLIRLLAGRYHTAYLSRGYLRRSKGFILARPTATAAQIGDEAFQIYDKFPGITVAVDANRAHGIDQIKSAVPDTQIVILDDAYQHRSIHPDLNILLIDYNRPLHTDHMLPLGRLRESGCNTDRADIIIVTKCPQNMLPVDMLSFRVQINPYPYQSLYFSTLEYLPPRPLAGNEIPSLAGYDILVVTGIAQPQHLCDHLKTFSSNINHIAYPDHHYFSSYDITHISREFEKLTPGNRAIIITEKDRMRLDADTLPDNIRPHIYSIGINVKFLFGMEEKFDSEIQKFAALRCNDAHAR